jgi:hypothetical protein
MGLTKEREMLFTNRLSLVRSRDMFGTHHVPHNPPFMHGAAQQIYIIFKLNTFLILEF